jgi:UDP-N-acetylglucosamine--N-acetylmuramyl-(pentapeptide) pyrophosphoryl-undecaprenol N-acetylglucosamine transferase
MAGGTGGHIFPALAVAQALEKQGFAIVWLGTKNGMEAKLVPEKGFEIEYVRFSGVRKSGILKWLALPFALAFACLQSAKIIFSKRPDVVLGMGGFASFPGGMTAAMLGKPLVIHEQNAIAGLSNRILSRFATRTLVAFPGALKKAIHVGNPVRSEIAALPDPAERFENRQGPLFLLVVGGSRGARALNDALPKALGMMEQKPHVLHQAGVDDLERVKASYREFGVNAEVVPFISDMEEAYGKADLIVCRSGALTVSEIAAAGLASVLVPYPHAVDDHQRWNARYLSESGAAFLIPQNEFEPSRLAELIESMDRRKLLEMASRARKLAMTDATEKVAEICMELAA